MVLKLQTLSKWNLLRMRQAALDCWIKPGHPEPRDDWSTYYLTVYVMTRLGRLTGQQGA